MGRGFWRFFINHTDVWDRDIFISLSLYPHFGLTFTLWKYWISMQVDLEHVFNKITGKYKMKAR